MPVYFTSTGATSTLGFYNLVRTTLTTTSETTVFTATAKTILRQVTIKNLTSTSITAGISIVPFAGTAATANRLFVADETLQGFQVLEFGQEFVVLNAGDFISAKCGTANALHLDINGEY